MTVPVAVRKSPIYTGNGAATSFAFDFKTFAKTDLEVVRTVIATGVETVLVLDSDYSVTLNGTQDVTPGGTITYPIAGSPLPSTHTLVIVSDLTISQPLDITNLGGFYPQTQEDAFDRAVMLIGQLEVDIARSVKVDVSSAVDPDDLIDMLVADAAAAAASAAASAASASAASTSATSASGSASAAAASAAAAQTIVDSVGFRDVLFKTFADSPITVTQAMSGKLLSIDTSGGNVVVTMPQISTLALPYTVGVKKTTGDAFTVTCNRSGTDLFDDGSTSLAFSTTGGAALIADTDSAPDKWSVASFGPVSGQQMKQQFVAGVGFTAGVSTTVTLTETPIASAEDAITVYQDGVYQQESEWSYAVATGVVTFTSVIGASVAKIEAVWVAPLAIGTVPFTQSGAGAVTRTSQEKMRDFVSVKDFGAVGDGANDDTAEIQAAITAAAAGAGNTVYFPPGIYKTGKLTVTKGGIRLIGASQESTTLNMVLGAAGDYCVDVDLSAGGLARPLSFGMENFTILGDDPVTRTYKGIKLYNVYHPQLKNIYYKSLAKCLTLGGTYWGTFENFWFEFYGTGIEGLSAAFSGNTNTFHSMLFFEGNSAGTAIPIDGTYMNNNTYIAPSFGSSVGNGNASIIAGNGDTFVGPRLETITSTDHWMKLGHNAKVINPLVGSQVALATGKYIFDVTGYNNRIECDMASIGRIIKFESTSQYNVVDLKVVTPVFGVQPVLDLGTNNRINFGSRDHMQGNDTNAAAQSWSDFRVYNYLSRSIDQNNLVADGLTKAIDNTERGPDLRGGCYKYDAPAGNRQVTQSIGAVGVNECYVMSFWVKAVAGGEHSTVQACFSESPSADYAANPITITSAMWTRVMIGKKFVAGFANGYFAIRLPVGHGGIWVYGPQVVYLGSNASSGELPPAYVGGYVPTDAAIRPDNAPRDPWRFQRGVPTGGQWFRGDRIVNLTLAAGAGIPGYVCITDGEPGTWKAEAVVAA